MARNAVPIHLLFLVTLFGLIFQGSDGVKDVQLEGPRYARRGEDLMLRCNYDLETDSLYAVKWYRGSEEFYRFLPKEAPPKQAFPINGVAVDVNKSDDHSVFLRNISFDTNGRFKCVISAEGTFQTLENAKDIEVIVIGYNAPNLSLDKMTYQPGEQGTAFCSVEGTYPAANITWFINGKQVHLSVMSKVVPVADERPGGGDGGSRRQQRKGGRGSGGYGYTTPYSSGGGGSGHAVSTTGSRIFSTPTSTSSQTTSPGRGGGGGLETGKKKDGGGGAGKKFGGGSSSGANTNVNNNSSGGGDKENKRQLTSSVSTLSFLIQSYSPLVIKCTGTFYDVYNETSFTRVQATPPMNNNNPYNNNRSVSTPRSSQPNYNQLQTYNHTASKGNKATTTQSILLTLSLSFLTTVLIFIVTTSAATAQFPHGVPNSP